MVHMLIIFLSGTKAFNTHNVSILHLDVTTIQETSTVFKVFIFFYVAS